MLFILSLSVVSMAHIPMFIDEVLWWPVNIVISSPRHKIIIKCDGIRDAIFLYFFRNIFALSLTSKLRCMHPDDDESLVFIFLIECLDMRYRTLTVNATKGPKIDQYHLSLKRLECEWLGIYPRSESIPLSCRKRICNWKTRDVLSFIGNRCCNFRSNHLVSWDIHSWLEFRWRFSGSWCFVCLISSWSEGIKKRLLPSTHIESIEDPGLDLFIHSWDDRDTDEDKYDAEGPLKPPGFTRKSSKTDNYRPSTDRYEGEHDGESERVDKGIDDPSNYWDWEYGRKEKGIGRRTGREYRTESGTRRNGSEDRISDVLSLIERDIWLTESESTSDPCPCMRKKIDESEGDEDTTRESLPERWRDVDERRRGLEEDREEDDRECEWERHDVGIPLLLLGERSREYDWQYGEDAGREDREHACEEGGDEEGWVHRWYLWDTLGVYPMEIKDRWSIWKKWLKYRGKWR